MPTAKSYIVATLWMFIINTSCLSQQAAVRFFDDQDGLPGMTIYGIKEDAKSILYLSTSKGICSFNGKEFKKYNTKGLKSLDTPFSFVDNEGTIWYYNLAGEILFLRNDSLHQLGIEKNNPNSKIYSFYVQNPYLYISWSNSAHQESYKYNLFDQQSKLKLNRNYIFLGTHEGQLLGYDINTRHHRFDLYSVEENLLLLSRKIEDESRMKMILETDLSRNLASGKMILVASNFIRTLDSCYQLIKEKYISDIVPGKVKYISFINEHELFISSTQGAYIYRHESEQLEKIQHFANITNTIYEDRLKRRWISTADNGLILDFNNQSLVYNRANQSMASDEVSTLCLKQDQIYIGHNNGLVSHYNFKNGSTEILSLNTTGRVRFIDQFDHLNFIVGLDLGIGINSMKAPLSVQCTGLTIGSIKDALYHYPEKLYIGSSLGVYECDPKAELNRPCAIGETVRKLEYRTNDLALFDSKIIAGTIQGLYSIPSSGSPQKLVARDFVITKLFNWNDSLLVICTDGEGVFFLDKQFDLDSFGTEQGLPSNNISDFCLINDHYAAIGTENGVYVYELKSGQGFTINHIDGLPGNEVTSIKCNGELLFIGTSKGMYSIPVERLSPNREIPFIEVQGSVVYTRSGKKPLTSRLSYNENHLQFKLFSRSLLSGHQLKIYYKLKKEDSLWIPAQGEILDFAGLSPGKYAIQFKALNEDQVGSNIAITEFTINGPWWYSFWFIGAVVLSLTGTSILITYRRQQNVRKEELKQQAIQDQINQLREEALQNQMNPHFIFNSLNAIQNFLANNDQLNAMGYLSKFGRLIRMIFEFSKHKRISLESEIEFLQHYLSLESLRFKDKVDIEFNISEEALEKSSELMIPPLLIQPIIENAFKHGLLHLESGGKLRIDLKLENEQVVCEIEDNGIGREKASMVNSWMKKNRKSSGIAFTKERLGLLSHGPIHGELNIIDLYNEDQNSMGTRAILKI